MEEKLMGMTDNGEGGFSAHGSLVIRLYYIHTER